MKARRNLAAEQRAEAGHGTQTRFWEGSRLASSLNADLIPLNDHVDLIGKRIKRRLQFTHNPKTSDAQLMKEFGRPTVGASPSCIVLSEAAWNYDLKTVHFNQFPSFHGLASEDALIFIRDFYGIIQIFPLQGVTEEELRMRCFPYTLKDVVKTWFMSLTPGSLRTWADVYNKFIGKYYSQSRTSELRRKIANFTQAEGEPFHEAWERFQMLLTQCPHHSYSLALQNQTFYDGLTQGSQAIVDNAAGGAMGEKTAEQTSGLFGMLGANSQEKSVRGKTPGIYEVGVGTELAIQISELSKQFVSYINQKQNANSYNYKEM